MVARLFVLLLIVCSHGCPAHAGDTNDAFKVVTYNIRYANPGDGADVWRNRVDVVAQSIAENDIVGLQEVTFAQLVDLRDRLNLFESYGVGRDDGENGGEHAVIFFRRDRFEAIDKGTIWLSENPDAIGVKGWDAALPRTCTWMVLRDKKSNQRLWVANTHFDHRGSAARLASGELIRHFAAKRAGSLPVIVMGDFNCVPDSDPYRALTVAVPQARGILLDARLISETPPQGPTSTWNGFREIVPDRIIDHVFVRGPLEIISHQTLNPKTTAGRFASDHLPVRVLARFTTASEASVGKSGE